MWQCNIRLQSVTLHTQFLPRSKVLAVVLIQVLWDTTICRLASSYWHFAGVCCLNVQCSIKQCSRKVSSWIHQNMEAESCPKMLLFSSTNGVTYQTTWLFINFLEVTEQNKQSYKYSIKLPHIIVTAENYCGFNIQW
jgi:hypothetical protein